MKEEKKSTRCLAVFLCREFYSMRKKRQGSSFPERKKKNKVNKREEMKEAFPT